MTSPSAASRPFGPRTWLTRYASLQQVQDAKLESILRQSEKDIAAAAKKLAEKQGIGSRVRRAQILSARNALRKLIDILWRDLGAAIRHGRGSAGRLALKTSFDWEKDLLRQIYPEADDRTAILQYLESTSDRAVEALVARVFVSQIPLSARVYRNSALSKRWVERAVNAGLARNASAAEIAADVRKLIRPDVRGGVSYAAKRLGRTEINNAYHAMAIANSQDKPWVSGMRWHLSRSHKRPDICNQMATADNGMGAGVYSTGSVPKKPHPQCLCYVTPELISMSLFRANLRKGIWDDLLEQKYGRAPSVG